MPAYFLFKTANHYLNFLAGAAFFFGLSSSLSVLLAENFSDFFAVILTASPVRGLRPVRAALSVHLNEPKPKIATSTPFLRDPAMPSKTASTAWAAAIFEMSAFSDTNATNSVLFNLKLLVRVLRLGKLLLFMNIVFLLGDRHNACLMAHQATMTQSWHYHLWMDHSCHNSRGTNT